MILQSNSNSWDPDLRESRFMGRLLLSPISYFFFFVIFIIPRIRDPLIRETPYMGWDFLVPIAILYPNKGNYNKITKNLEIGVLTKLIVTARIRGNILLQITFLHI